MESDSWLFQLCEINHMTLRLDTIGDFDLEPHNNARS